MTRYFRVAIGNTTVAYIGKRPKSAIGLRPDRRGSQRPNFPRQRIGCMDDSKRPMHPEGFLDLHSDTVVEQPSRLDLADNVPEDGEPKLHSEPKLDEFDPSV